jgi:hypothetical protein
MDSLGMGLGAARDELAPLQLTECIRCPKPWSGKGNGLASTKSGLAALRDFDAAFDRFGSNASRRYARDARGMSAMPPLATKSVPRNEPSRYATSGHALPPSRVVDVA